MNGNGILKEIPRDNLVIFACSSQLLEVNVLNSMRLNECMRFDGKIAEMEFFPNGIKLTRKN